MSETMNPLESHPAYVCGELLAVFDQIQRAALGKLKANVVDKYYGGFSAAPLSVDPLATDGSTGPALTSSSLMSSLSFFAKHSPSPRLRPKNAAHISTGDYSFTTPARKRMS